MSARAARRTRKPEVVANSHRHSNQLSREQLYRENERLLRENEELRRKVGNAKVRLPNTKSKSRTPKSKSRTPKSKSRTPKSKSPIWSGNWLDGRRTLPTPPSHLPPTDWPESRDRAAESTRASASRVPSPDIRGIIDPCFPRPQRAPLRCCCRSNAGTAGQAYRKSLER